MNRACNKLLAGSSLACDQYGCVGRTDTVDSLKNLFEAGAAPNDAVRYLPSATESTGLPSGCGWVVDRSRHQVLHAIESTDSVRQAARCCRTASAEMRSRRRGALSPAGRSRHVRRRTRSASATVLR